MALTTTELTDAQFERLSDLVRKIAGINLHDGKKELVKARLNKRLRALNLRSFDEYLQVLAKDPGAVELTAMLDAISTNLTSFFREAGHFRFLAESILPRLAADAAKSGKRKLRVWSAGCSSGEEPYTIAMVLAEHLPDFDRWDIGILATDLSTRVLDRASQGQYAEERMAGVAQPLRTKYFTNLGNRGERVYRINDKLRRLVTFGRLNLMETWPMRGPFDVIFCRNVMIYFDKPTQGRLVDRYWDILAPGGILFIGHSESLTGVKHRFKYVEPTVYQRPKG